MLIIIKLCPALLPANFLHCPCRFHLQKPTHSLTQNSVDTWALVRFCDCPGCRYTYTIHTYMHRIHFINIMTSSIKYQSMLTGAYTCVKWKQSREIFYWLWDALCDIMHSMKWNFYNNKYKCLMYLLGLIYNLWT